MEDSSRTSKSLQNVKDRHCKGNRQSKIKLVARWNDTTPAGSHRFSFEDFNPSESTPSGGSNDLEVGIFRGKMYASDSDGTVSMESGQWHFSDEPSLIIVSKDSMPNERRPSRPLVDECSEATDSRLCQATPTSEKHESDSPPIHNIDFNQSPQKNLYTEFDKTVLHDHSPVVVDDSIKVLIENSIPPNRQVYALKKGTLGLPPAHFVTVRTLIPLDGISTSLQSDGEEKKVELENQNLILSRSLSISEVPVFDQNAIKSIDRQLSETVEHGDKIGLTVLNLDQVFSKHEGSVGTILSKAPRILSLLSMYGNEKYFRVCCNLRGRTLPWQPMCILICWVFCLYLIHSFGLGLIFSDFDWKLGSWMYRLFGISIGFLLKQHATVANDRWMEARKTWEDIVGTTRSLGIILASTLECSKLMREAVSHVIGCPICIKNYIMGIEDDDWKSELMMIFPPKNCERVMRCRKRTRATFCLYACQRVVESMITNKLLTRAVARDINPKILKLSHFSGDCARIRYTQVPYGYFLHIRFLLVVYLMFLPLLLIGIDGISWDAIILYLLLISYAYAGLESMATEILNPFDRDESDHPLDLYCYLNVSDMRFMFGKGFGEKSNFVKSFESGVVPTLQQWLKNNIPGFTVVNRISKITSGCVMVTKSRILPFGQLNELIYELYSEEKADQKEKARKRRIREYRKQRRASVQDMLFKGLL